jgi:hypothetical protein
MNTTYRHAENANAEIGNLARDLQTLIDAHARGVPVRTEDLQHLRALLGFARYHVARTMHASINATRSEERRELALEANHHA